MRRVIVVTGGRIVGALLQTVILIVLARNSGLAEFGQFSAGYAAGTVIGAVTNFGVTQWVLRVDEDSEERHVHLARGTAVALGGVAAILTFGVTLALGRDGLTAGVAAAAAAGANLLSDSTLGPNQNILFREGRVVRAVLQQLAVRVVPFVAVLAAFVVGIDPFSLLWIAFVITSIGLMIVSGPMRVRWSESLWLIRNSIHYWRESLWAMLRQLDTVVVSLLLGVTPTAAYAASARLASPIHIVTTSVSSIFVPQLSRLTRGVERRTEADRMMWFGYAYTALILVLSPVALWLGPLLLGSEYRAYDYLFLIAIVTSGLNVVAQLLTTVLFADGDAKKVADITRTTTVIGLAAVIVFAALHSLPAVALSTIAVQILLNVWLIGYSRRRGLIGRLRLRPRQA